MNILRADYILSCDNEFNIYEDSAIAFNDKIIAIGNVNDLKSKYLDAKFHDLGDNSIIMPGLINLHTHLEFSSNKDELDYGDFITWLNSVIRDRQKLINECNKDCIDKVLDDILLSGTTTIGAVSSFGYDLNSCVESSLRVIYFNEILGSDPASVDILYSDFLNRLDNSKEYKNTHFIPAVSIHSPYSTHPILAKKVLEIAKKESLFVSTHFMESKAERDWLDSGSGDFREFFNKFNPHAKPLILPTDYIKLFKGLNVLFTHCCYANSDELELIKTIGSITHSPRSNRLLANQRLEIKKLDTFTLATDGLSSNNTLSLWDEMRAALLIHYDLPLENLAKRLIYSVTRDGADSLNLNVGTLEVGKESDLITLKLDKIDSKEKLPLSILLFTNKPKSVYIGGKRLK